MHPAHLRRRFLHRRKFANIAAEGILERDSNKRLTKLLILSKTFTASAPPVFFEETLGGEKAWCPKDFFAER